MTVPSSVNPVSCMIKIGVALSISNTSLASLSAHPGINFSLIVVTTKPLESKYL